MTKGELGEMAERCRMDARKADRDGEKAKARFFRAAAARFAELAKEATE